MLVVRGTADQYATGGGNNGANMLRSCIHPHSRVAALAAALPCCITNAPVPDLASQRKQASVCERLRGLTAGWLAGTVLIRTTRARCTTLRRTDMSAATTATTATAAAASACWLLRPVAREA